MPAAHPDDAQSDSVSPAQPETAATSPAGADEALPESDDTVSEPASAQGLNAATTEPEVEPKSDISIESVDGNESSPGDEISETVVVNDPAEPAVATSESDKPVTEDEEAMHGDNPESAVPEPEIAAIVIEENADPIAPDVEGNDNSGKTLSTEEQSAIPDSSTEQPVDANPSPLEEAAFEEILPYSAEAGSEWEPSSEPDEIFALDEIEYGDSSESEAEALVVSNDPQPVDEPSASSDTGADAMQRANQLIDELRGLLPALTKPALTVQSPDYASLREQALMARGDVSFDQFAALREVVQEALSRPRDVEVVLRLSRRVEDMSALLGERDRLQQAFEQLIIQLDANGAS